MRRSKRRRKTLGRAVNSRRLGRRARDASGALTQNFKGLPDARSGAHRAAPWAGPPTCREPRPWSTAPGATP